MVIELAYPQGRFPCTIGNREDETAAVRSKGKRIVGGRTRHLHGEAGGFPARGRNGRAARDERQGTGDERRREPGETRAQPPPRFRSALVPDVALGRQRPLHLTRRTESIGVLLGAGLLDQIDEALWEVRRLVSKQLSGAHPMRVADVGDAVPAYRPRSRDEMEQEHADRVDICRRIGPVPEQQLGRSIERCANDAWIRIERDIEHAARAEVHDDDSAGALAHHVLGLDVAVDEAHRMNSRERATDGETDERRFLRAHRTFRFDEIASVRPWMNSIQMPTRPSIRSAPYTATTWRWLALASKRPSATAPRVSGAAVSSGCSSFSATSRWRRGSHAR
jgi:hypothetical protein